MKDTVYEDHCPYFGAVCADLQALGKSDAHGSGKKSFSLEESNPGLQNCYNNCPPHKSII